ncbi:MAG: hypothetical protein JWM53_4132 [bacterium]|nr:hypothetical protein [bacterium]
MDLDAEYAELAATVRIVPKADVWHQRAIHQLLRVVTLGAQSAYLDRYVTTLWHTVYVTDDWESRPIEERYATLRHELVHVRQFERWGVIMAIAYLLLPLPLGLSYFRMRFEREAYEETLRVWHALGGRAACERRRAHIVAQFTSGSYGWMWPFPRAMERWFDRFVSSL